MKTRRHDPADTSGPHDEFWGEQTEWTPQRPPSAERAGVGATLGRWWNSLLGGGTAAARTHGGRAVPSSPSDESDRLDREPIAHRRVERGLLPRRPDHDIDDLGDDLGDNAWEFEAEPQPTRHPGVDPLLARLGGLAVIVTLAAPLVIGFTASGSDSPAAESMPAPIVAAPASELAEPATSVDADPAPASTTDVTTSVAPPESTLDLAAVGSPETTPSDAVATEPEASAPPTPVAALLEPAQEPEPAETAPPEVTTPACGGRYEVAAGDYWIRLADAAGVSLAELLAVNESSTDTVLVPGRSICLPVGAATPSPPPTAAPAPSAAPTAPAATAAPSRPTTTAAPAPTTTTAAPAPATTVPSRPAAVSQSQAVAIIRSVWPDELEERALEIAWRESNHQSNVNNYCCYGLFQIHWTAHRSWLATIGVTSASQLFDPVVNATAAYTLYQRSGGFGPWGG